MIAITRAKGVPHKNHVANGIVKADTMFIRNLYQELSREHRI